MENGGKTTIWGVFRACGLLPLHEYVVASLSHCLTRTSDDGGGGGGSGGGDGGGGDGGGGSGGGGGDSGGGGATSLCE